MCIDPYFSLAADLSIYKLGDVIYIPDAVGLQLPGGSQHNGYFIVRDTGGGIKGHGRFDFFSGFDSLKNPSHPFRKLQFNDRTTHVPFFLVTGSVAQEILDMRNFLLLLVLNWFLKFKKLDNDIIIKKYEGVESFSFQDFPVPQN